MLCACGCHCLLISVCTFTRSCIFFCHFADVIIHLSTCLFFFFFFTFSVCRAVFRPIYQSTSLLIFLCLSVIWQVFRATRRDFTNLPENMKDRRRPRGSGAGRKPWPGSEAEEVTKRRVPPAWPSLGRGRTRDVSPKWACCALDFPRPLGNSMSRSAHGP